jgi:hypothetical protein
VNWGAEWKCRMGHRAVAPAQGDDIRLNDAFAALWTARRIAAGKSETLAPAAEFDETGVRMEITV